MKLDASSVITFLVLLAIGFQAFAAVIPDVQRGANATYTAGYDINESDGEILGGQPIPLGGLFTSNGVIILLVVAAFVVLVVKATKSR